MTKRRWVEGSKAVCLNFFFSLSIFSRSLSVVRVHALRHDDAADASDDDGGNELE